MKKIFVIIPVYNRIQFTRNCLLSLQNQNYKYFETIVIDDGSTDGTSEMIKKEFPWVILLQGNGNLWWSRSINMGIKYALDHNAEYMLTLNDDLEVPEDYIEALLYEANRFPSTIIGSAHYDASNRNNLIYFGEEVNWLLAKSRMNRIENRGGNIDYAESDVLPGRGLLLPANVFKEVGLFDARLFRMGPADHDLVWRAKKAGFRVICTLSARIYAYTDETAVAKFKGHKSLSNFLNYFFSLKSSANLKMRLHFALKNCPRHLLISYLILDFIRLTGSYFLKKQNSYFDRKQS